MGWFDKKSWHLRQKIRDLQADLREAEREGKFVVEQGLFFAELEDMGEATMMVFGTTDVLAAQEESVIRTFYDRNGFSVDSIKLDKGHTSIATIEIIPPEEMIKLVGRYLKNLGYRVVDDSEREAPADLNRKVYPLSAIIRSVTILFSEKVQQVISTTHIKMNKEGNRLLRWLPKIIEATERKVPMDAVEEVRPGFEQAYDQLFRKMGMHESVPSDRLRSVSPGAAPSEARIPKLNFPAPPAAAAQPPASTPAARGNAPSQPVAKSAPAAVKAAPAPAAPHAAPALGDLQKLVRRRDMAEMMARLYQSLIRAKSNRCVQNSERLLQEINACYHAAATCLMVKVPQGDNLTIHAQAGHKLLWGESESGDGYAISAKILARCMQQREPVMSDSLSEDPTSSMVAHHISATAAVPIIIDREIAGMLYLDRREGVQPFTSEDATELREIVGLFTAYADLTLGRISPTGA
jgi:hypothetical protein